MTKTSETNKNLVLDPITLVIPLLATFFFGRRPIYRRKKIKLAETFKKEVFGVFFTRNNSDYIINVFIIFTWLHSRCSRGTRKREPPRWTARDFFPSIRTAVFRDDTSRKSWGGLQVTLNWLKIGTNEVHGGSAKNMKNFPMRIALSLRYSSV